MSTVHNPDNVDRPGNGYRFLDDDEVELEYFPGAVEMFMPEDLRGTVYEKWVYNVAGASDEFTYRTNLTRKQLHEQRAQS